MKQYIYNILISLDQLANAITGGDPDETISSRAAKRQHLIHWRVLGYFLEKIDPGHLERAREDDEGRDQVV